MVIKSSKSLQRKSSFSTDFFSVGNWNFMANNSIKNSCMNGPKNTDFTLVKIGKIPFNASHKNLHQNMLIRLAL
jgi:hypothetical protein